MNGFYTSQEAKRWQRRAKNCLIFSAALIVLALGACIVMCLMVTTANAQKLQLAAVSLFTLAGWTDILLFFFVYAPARAQAEHIGGMLTQEPLVHEGVLTLLPEVFRIPRSITVRKASLMTADGAISLSVSAALSRQLPQGKPLRVWTVRGFITAWEVLE